MRYFVLAVVVLCGGCSAFHSDPNELYQFAKNGPDLNVPHDLSTASISHFYDLPNQKDDPIVSIKPPVGDG